MAGWCAVLDFGPDHPRVLWEVQNGMQEALCLWLYGVGRRSHRRERRISKRVAATPSRLWPYIRSIPSLESTVLRRVGIERLWSALTQGRPEQHQNQDQAILTLLLEHWPATTIHAEGRRRGRQSGIGDRAMLNGKRRIRRLAEKLELRDD